MAGSIFVGDSLATQFQQFKSIQDLVHGLTAALTKIDDENKQFAGHGQIGRAYLEKAGPASHNLFSVVTLLADALGLTGDSGSAVARDFSQADADGSAVARSWRL